MWLIASDMETVSYLQKTTTIASQQGMPGQIQTAYTVHLDMVQSISPQYFRVGAMRHLMSCNCFIGFSELAHAVNHIMVYACCTHTGMYI